MMLEVNIDLLCNKIEILQIEIIPRELKNSWNKVTHQSPGITL